MWFVSSASFFYHSCLACARFCVVVSFYSIFVTSMIEFAKQVSSTSETYHVKGDVKSVLRILSAHNKNNCRSPTVGILIKLKL